MQNSNAWIWWLVAAIIVIGGGYWWYTSSSATSGAAGTIETGTGVPGANETGPAGGTNVNTGTPNQITITYDGTSFSPASVTIKQGGSVTFTSTAGNMWVASGPHPEHTGYGGTSRSEHCATGYTGATPFDQCVAGTTYTFTFDKVGTWPFHNHIKAGAYGSVTVVQ